HFPAKPGERSEHIGAFFPPFKSEIFKSQIPANHRASAPIQSPVAGDIAVAQCRASPRATRWVFVLKKNIPHFPAQPGERSEYIRSSFRLPHPGLRFQLQLSNNLTFNTSVAALMEML